MMTLPWYNERIKICNTCPFNSKNVENKKGLRYWFWNILNLKEPFCTVCGCEIKAKASEEIEECEKEKWKSLI